MKLALEAGRPEAPIITILKNVLLVHPQSIGGQRRKLSRSA